MSEPIFLTLAAAAVVVSIPMLWYSLAGARSASGSAARNLGGGTLSDLRDIKLRDSARDRAIKPLMGALARQGRRVTPQGLVMSLERRLILAGTAATWSIERVLALKLTFAVVGAALGTLRFVAAPSTSRLLFAIVTTLLGYFLVDLILFGRARERQREILHALPDTLDQLSIAVEAGLGFEAAMARIGRTGSGPLADEMVRTLQEIQIGQPRSTALRHLVDRTNVSDLRHFVLAIVQAEAYGVPIANVLRVQSGEMRVRRRQRAEEQAMKLPVKLVFPLVLCILPALFIIVIEPGALRIMDTLFGGGL